MRFFKKLIFQCRCYTSVLLTHLQTIQSAVCYRVGSAWIIYSFASICSRWRWQRRNSFSRLLSSIIRNQLVVQSSLGEQRQLSSSSILIQFLKSLNTITCASQVPCNERAWDPRPPLLSEFSCCPLKLAWVGLRDLCLTRSRSAKHIQDHCLLERTISLSKPSPETSVSLKLPKSPCERLVGPANERTDLRIVRFASNTIETNHSAAIIPRRVSYKVRKT